MSWYPVRRGTRLSVGGRVATLVLLFAAASAHVIAVTEGPQPSTGVDSSSMSKQRVHRFDGSMRRRANMDSSLPAAKAGNSRNACSGDEEAWGFSTNRRGA